MHIRVVSRDVRLSRVNLAPVPSSISATYLLRDDVAHPLSVDYSWWPKARPGKPGELVVVGTSSASYPGAEELPVVTDLDGFLGYDVADETFVSGLSNCSFDADVVRYRTRFGARLSKDHLFLDSRDAEEFRIDCDERVPEHRPFYVYALYVPHSVAAGAPAGDGSRGEGS